MWWLMRTLRDSGTEDLPKSPQFHGEQGRSWVRRDAMGTLEHIGTFVTPLGDHSSIGAVLDVLRMLEVAKGS